MTTRRQMPARSRQAGWTGFVRRYGWRAYALPILSAVTVAAVVHGAGSPAPNGQAVGAGHDATAATTPRPSPSRVDPSSTAAAATHGDRTQFEGLTSGERGFQAGSTPAPVVINLKTDRATSCASNKYPQLVLVSISSQHLWACRGSKQVESSAVTTGKVTDGDQTPLGSWRVQAKQRDRYLVGPGYRDYVRYWVPFNGDFGLHDAPWQTMPFGSSQWRTEGSHGCVHTPTKVMAWIYHWVKVGSTVVTIER